jgi:hypothetical protein
VIDKDGELKALRAELASLRSRLAAREAALGRLGDQLADAQSAVAERGSEAKALHRELRVARALLGEKDATVEAAHSSLSWRLTAPLRAVRALVTRLASPPKTGTNTDGPIDPGEMVAAAPKVCIFAHYDPQASVADYVFELLRGISAAGYAILFVSSAKRIAGPDLDRLRAVCTRVHIRRNAGRDFGSWQFGLRRLTNLENLDWLLLANDSVFGPLFDLGDIAKKMEHSGADFWGITDSYQKQWHLQSYFICFKGDIVRSGTFRGIFAKDFAALTKRQLIDLGEIELSQALLGTGYAGAAYCPYEALDEGRYDFSRNPTHHFWDKLVAEARCPFLKIELLRENPLQVPDVERFRQVVSEVSGYDVRLMESYLGAFCSTPQKRRLPNSA